MFARTVEAVSKEFMVTSACVFLGSLDRTVKMVISSTHLHFH